MHEARATGLRASHFRAGVFIGFVALVAGGASCTSLPDIEAGTCGNGVVEPDHNEDCDSPLKDDAGKALCYPAGSAAPCHFDCSTAACPAGFSCGIDAVCRKPKGLFAEVGHPTQVAADRLFTGDFDQDGRGDVVAETDVQMEVLYGDQTDNIGAPFIIRAEGNPAVGQRSLELNPAVGALAIDPGNPDSESNTDIVFTKSVGVTTWRGRTDRTLIPTGYTSFHIGTNQPQLMTLLTTSFTHDVLMLLPGASLPGLTFDGTIIVEIVGGTLGVNQFFGLIPTSKPADLAGSPLIADLDTTPASPCEEYVLGFQGAGAISMFRTCTAPGVGNVIKASDIGLLNPPGYVRPLSITLPSQTTVRTGGIGVHAADLNGDGVLDLFVDGQGPLDGGGTGLVTLAAYGLGNGTFSSSPTLAPIDNAASKLLEGGPLLAAGQLTKASDLAVDLVFPTGLVLDVPASGFGSPDAGADAGESFASLDFPADIPWTEAAILDVDGDQVPDVIAGAPNRVDFYRGTSTEIVTHVPYVVDGTVGGFQVGDFDGDFASDIAFRATHADGTSDVNVMWGHLFSFPENPAFVGRFPNILSTTHGIVASDVGNNDALTDLGVLTETGAGTDQASFDVSVLAGSPTRQLQSVFFLQQGQGTGNPGLGAFPLAYTVGQFTRGDAHPDLAMAAAVSRDQTKKRDDHLDMKIVVAQGSGAGLLINPPVFAPDSFDSFNAFQPGTDASGNPSVVPFADWTHLSLAGVDFDGPGGDGVDELVGIAPAIATAGSFFWAKLDGDSWKVEAITPRGAPAAPTENRSSIAQVLTADVNGDGAKDVLLLSDTGTSSSLTAYINARDGKFPTKSAPISLPVYASGQTETPFHIVAIAAIDADSDPGKEIALLTQPGSTSTSAVGGLFLAKSDANGDSFSVTGPLCSDGSGLNGCANNLRSQIPSGNAIAAVDSDGDGVEDLVVESGQTLPVYKGLAVDP